MYRQLLYSSSISSIFSGWVHQQEALVRPICSRSQHLQQRPRLSPVLVLRFLQHSCETERTSTPDPESILAFPLRHNVFISQVLYEFVMSRKISSSSDYSCQLEDVAVSLIGAVLGGAIGSVVPGLGTIVGAVAGAVIGKDWAHQSLLVDAPSQSEDAAYATAVQQLTIHTTVTEYSQLLMLCASLYKI